MLSYGNFRKGGEGEVIPLFVTLDSVGTFTQCIFGQFLPFSETRFCLIDVIHVIKDEVCLSNEMKKFIEDVFFVGPVQSFKILYDIPQRH